MLPSEGFFTFTLGLRIFTESFLSCFLDNELKRFMIGSSLCLG